MHMPVPPQLHFPSPYERPHVTPLRAELIERPDGAKIAAFAYGADAPWKENPEDAPVLFLHGNGEEHGIFGPTIDAVVAGGNPAIGVDSRGQGKSTRGHEHLTYELMEADALAVMDAWGIEKFHILGFSDGGILALLLARDCPERVLSCTASGANLSPEGILSDGWDVEGAARELDDWASWTESLDPAGAIDPALLTPAAAEARTTADLLRLMDEEPHIEAKSLMSISCPTTIMAGENDVIKPEETEAIASAIPGAELVIVPGHGHTLPKEAPPDVTDALFRTMVRACEES